MVRGGMFLILVEDICFLPLSMIQLQVWNATGLLQIFFKLRKLCLFLVCWEVVCVCVCVCVLIRNECYMLSNNFSALIDMFIWFLFFILLIWYILLIHFEMLNHSSRINPLSRINPTTCLWYIVLFIYCWVQLVNIC